MPGHGTGPVLGLLAEPRVPPGVVPLLARLQRWCDVRAAATLHRPAPAYLATSPRVRGLDEIAAPPARVAVWVGAPDDVPAALALEVPAERRVFVSADAGVLDLLAGHADTVVAVPTDRHDALDRADLAPRSPVVRSRWRRRVGYPERFVVSVSASAGADLSPGESLVPTALAVAAAAVTDDPGTAAIALALGCPLVVDPATAEALGATDGRQVLVAPDLAAARRRAVEVAADDHLASQLGRDGRLLADSRFDLALAAERLVRHLGLLDDGPGHPDRRLVARLDELRTPAHSRVAERAQQAIEGLPGSA